MTRVETRDQAARGLGAGLAPLVALAALFAGLLAPPSSGQDTWDLSDRPAGFTIHSPQGWGLTQLAAGDANGDGIEDLGLGGGALSVAVWPGAPGLSGSVDLEVRTPMLALTGFEGGSRPAFGDLNADGIADVAVGDPGYDPGAFAGIVYVYFGRRGGPAFRRISTDPPDLTVHARAGCSLIGMFLKIGDVSGDGIADLVAAGYGNDVWPCPAGGEMVVVFGRPGLGGTIDWRTTPGDAWIWGGTRYTSLALGDVTGDGIADVVLGARFEGPGREGVVHVYRGGVTLAGALDPNAPDFTLLGKEAGDGLGEGVAAGDLDGDTVGDIVAGASGGDGPGNACPDADPTGEIAVVRGGPSLPALVDLSASLPDATVYPPSCGAGAGPGIETADWTGDGVADLLMAAPGADGPGGLRPNCGEAYVVAGGPGMLGELDLAVNPPSLRVIGVGAGESMGVEVSQGDLDGDALRDLLLTSRRPGPAGGGRSGGAAAYMIPGRMTGGAFTVLRSAGDPRGLLPHATPAGSPFDDSPGVLGDGATYFYGVQGPGGVNVRLSVARNPSARTVRLSWRDGTPGSAVPIDPGRSTVAVSGGCARPDGLTSTEVRVVPKDADGVPLGAGLSLRLDPVSLGPARAAGGFEDLGNGTYRAWVSSTIDGVATIAVDVESVRVTSSPSVIFTAASPEASLATTPSETVAGGSITLSGSASQGVAPYAFAWDSDGDGALDASGPGLVRAYPRDGAYAVRLVAADSNACLDWAAGRILVAR